MQLQEIMTQGVVTAGADADLGAIAALMRDKNVGSVVICDADGRPAAMVTDRDLAVRGMADERRLPVVAGGELVGIVTLDDIAVRTGNLEVAQRMTRDVIEGAIPGFFFHE